MSNSNVSNQVNYTNNLRIDSENALPTMVTWTPEELKSLSFRCSTLLALGKNTIERLFILHKLSTKTEIKNAKKIYSLDVQKVFCHIVNDMTKTHASTNELYFLYSLFCESNFIVETIDLLNKTKAPKVFEAALQFPASARYSVGKESPQAHNYRLMGAMLANISKGTAHSKVELFCSIAQEFKFLQHFPTLVENLVSLELTFQTLISQGLISKGKKFSYANFEDEEINTKTKKSFASLSEVEKESLEELFASNQRIDLNLVLNTIFDKESADVLCKIFKRVLNNVV